MKILITDAYSASNLGDAELVRLTIESARTRFGQRPTIFATDPLSFEKTSDGIFLEKPLSRRAWRSKNTVNRLFWLSSEILALAALEATRLVPLQGRSAYVRYVRRFFRKPWLHAIASADRIVAVGGGYLGDKYLRESVVSLCLYRFALARGIEVETMPLSITSSDSFLLRKLLQSTKSVRWRCRETHTLRQLEALGLSPDLVPDLAWLNAREIPNGVLRSGMVIAPIGSKFYADNSRSSDIWPVISTALKQIGSGEEVALVAMHFWDNALGDGQDDVTCKAIAARIYAVRPDLKIRVSVPKDYFEVRQIMSRSRLAICQRLHAALAALTTGTPVQVIGYEPKHQGVLSLAGLAGLNSNTDDFEFPHSSQIREAAEIQMQHVTESVL